MWDASKCDRCGDCLAACLYVDWDREKCVAEITRLIDEGDSEILTACVTCCACNEYCHAGADPWDLILHGQERTGCLDIVPRAPAMFELSASLPSDVRRGDPVRPALSRCVMEPLCGDVASSKLFEGMTVIKGGDYFCKIGYLHIGQEAPIRQGAQGVVDRLEAVGASEIVCFHEDCYALLAVKAPEYGVHVPFRPVHLFEHLLRVLEEHAGEVRPLGLRVAYQRPCASRYSGDREPLLDEIFARIGVTRVERQYDRTQALCCGGPLLARGDLDGSVALGRRNVEDAVRAGAERLAFLCPMCGRTLRLACDEVGLARVSIPDLCRMALGEHVEA